MAILKRIAKCAALLIGLSLPLLATEQIATDHFGYLNNNEAPAIIDTAAAQDLLNVDVTPGGKSIKKRSGYGSYKTVTGSQPMHGGYHFFDTSGNDVQVWGSSTSLFGIVADASPTQLISSATLNTTWDCADTQGNAYCVDSSRDALIKTNGATKTWYSSPLGTMVAVTPERLLIAGVAAAPNSIYISGASDFANFTTGITVPDSFVEQIAAPGSKLTHIEYACNRWLWWKDQSFGYVLGTDQTNLSIKIVSSQIGSQDNSSAVDPDGNVYFRAQDGHIYKYDCTNLMKLTTDITPSIQTSGRRTANLYLQTTQTDWQSGTILPTNSLSTTLSPGDVMPSSFSITETATTDWAQGTLTNLEVTGGTSLIISTSTAATGWTGFSGPNAGPLSTWNPTDNCGTVADKGGDTFVIENSNGGTAITLTVTLEDASTAAVIATVTVPWANNSCSWTQRTLTVGSSNARRRAKVHVTGGLSVGFSGAFTLTGADVIFYTLSDTDGAFKRIFMDSSINDGSTFASAGISSISQGTYQSKAYSLSVSTISFIEMDANWTANTLVPSLVLQGATSSAGPWTNITLSTGVSIVNSAYTYVRYLSTFTIAGNASAYSTLDDVTIVGRSSGTYYSPVVNRPNLTSWDTLNATYVNNSGSHAFYLRSSTNSFAVGSATPTWTAQTPGNVISISTGTWFEFRDDFVVTASSQNPTLSDFQINWFEGTASDKAYATYFDNAIWWALAFGAGQSTNNYIFKFDLLNPGWTLYNIPASGFLTQNNALYFGSPSTNSIYRFGNSTSDNGSSINAYWQSKDFPGTDPWLENSYAQMDVIVRRNTGQSLTVGYTLNASTTTTSFSVSLSSTTDATIRYKKLLPAGKLGGLINVKFSDTSTTSAWEVLGMRVKYEPMAYRPTQ